MSKKDKALVVDTSVFGVKGSADVILNYEKVILLTQTIREMDKRKKMLTTLGYNIRIIMKESARDYKSKQFIVVDWPEKDYTDETIIDYCKDKDVILYVADFGLANLAKGYNIEYILAEDDSDSMEVQEDNIPLTHLANTTMSGDNLILQLPDSMKIDMLVLDANMEEKHPNSGATYITLQKGDLVVVSTYKAWDHRMSVAEYEVRKLCSDDNAVYLKSKNIYKKDEIADLDYPEDIKAKIRSYFVIASNNSKY